jgi:thiamine biosynthesis lipoprotein
VHIEPRGPNLEAVCFTAMASPCEILLPASVDAQAMKIGALVAQEAWRVEKKFSRYRDDSVLAWIHRNRGMRLELDGETAAMLDFAQHCFDISDGLFDITSGILRRAWRFDGSDRIPSAESVERLLPLVGFEKLTWQAPYLTLPSDMELDFGGIGKEYAVDRAYEIVAQHCTAPFLGDSRRYVVHADKRYGHVLDPRTGWPVRDAPRSVTVAASSCTEAGLLSTMALLQGRGAEHFLREQGVRYWLIR